MPLLPLEPFLYPENLLALAPACGDARWWVLHTRPRAEKTLARHLLSRATGFFLPLYQRQWRSGGKVRSAYLPLFPGYLFLHGDVEARQRALETSTVVQSLTVPDQARLHADLVRVHALATSGTDLSAEGRLRPGTRVRLIGGPLAGLEGTVLKQGKKLRFVVEVELLQQGVSAEVESWMLEPLAGGASF
ncbi:MAG: UpxY family transcription antiterminator [Gemmataceae bacterium]|nr:UpxY family transcription antiterminator [Gemmataceae bacterium]